MSLNELVSSLLKSKISEVKGQIADGKLVISQNKSEMKDLIKKLIY